MTEQDREKWWNEWVKIQEWVAMQPYKNKRRVVWNIRSELSAIQSAGIERARQMWLTQYKDASFNRMLSRLKAVGFTEADFNRRKSLKYTEGE